MADSLTRTSSARFTTIEEFWKDLELKRDIGDLALARYIFYTGAMAGALLEHKGIKVEEQVKDWILEVMLEGEKADG